MLLIFENFDWTILAILATIVVPWTFYLLKREKKELSYNFSAVPLLSVASGQRERVEVVLNNVIVENVYLISFELINSGSFNIRKRDFGRDIVINFDEKSHVMELDIVSTTPYTLHPEVINGGNSIIIKPIDLRSKNCIKIKSLVDYYTGYTFDFSFAGAGKIRSQIEMHNLSSRDKTVLILYAIAAGLFSFALYKFTTEQVPAVYTVILSAMNINIMYFVYRLLLKNK